ncbi:uncharacterized protein LOC128559357 [Mercenaria mercenaria]|uniref:uncharacterized protein LOC128559357 n=1 Tax=Mercenaria mercenaria TaxID=6596 RepID=UPI00234F3956|nr:uncharacterized protein LOC128559357 [Mercenaria mercenaria]
MRKMFAAQMDLQKELVQNKQLKKETVKLPKIDIPSFNGNKLYWIEFWDSFESAVHNNDRLSEVDKFNYLKSKLTGEAKHTITGLSLSNKNYEIAIQTLHKRFGDRQETIDLHYKALIDIFPVRNSVESLRQFMDKTEKHLRCLEVLNQDTNQEVFVSMLRRKLPNDVLLQMEIMKGVDKKWSVITFRELLRQYIVAKEKAEITDKAKSKFENRDSVRPNSNPRYSMKGFSKPSIHSASSSSLITSEKQEKTKVISAKCRYCDRNHWSDECTKYPTIEDRKKRIKGSCYRCLKEGHISSQCKSSKTCVYCGQVDVHHRSLCEKKFKEKKNKEES